MILLDTEPRAAVTKFLMSSVKNTEIDGRRVRIAREAKGLSQPQLADLVGMSQQGINEIEQGRSKRPRKLPEIAEALGRSTDWLLAKTDEDIPDPSRHPSNASFPPTFIPFPDRKLPLLGQSVAGPNGRFVLNGQQVGSVFCPPVLDGVDGAYAVLVYGTSMEPKFEAGETVWLHPYLPVRRGDYVVAQVVSDETGTDLDSYIKQFVSRSATKLILRQFNPDEGEDAEFEIAAERVVSIHKIVFQQLL